MVRSPVGVGGWSRAGAAEGVAGADEASGEGREASVEGAAGEEGGGGEGEAGVDTGRMPVPRSAAGGSGAGCLVGALAALKICARASRSDCVNGGRPSVGPGPARGGSGLGAGWRGARGG